MKVKKLVTLAVPFMLLVGCGSEKTDAKPKEKVESKAETKEKLSKDKYPDRITAISTEFLQKVTEMSETAKDRTTSDNEVSKKILAQVKDIQKIIKKFDTIEPPVEYRDAHKDILKAVDCYKEAYSIQEEILTSDKKADEKELKDKAVKSKDLLKKGSELWVSGYKPIQDAIVGKTNEIKDNSDSKTDSLSTSDTSTLSNKDVQLSISGKELVGEWGSYEGSEFIKAVEFLEDGTYIAYDDKGKTPYEQNHMEGSWFYTQEKNQVSLTAKEVVKNGKKIDTSQLKVAVDYKVDSFKDDSFKMTDAKGNSLQAEKRK
ncbi:MULTISPECIES: DUF3994 domain-containing protein [Bacillus]|uniref:DUF3994 domain-containing protein n=2 Tax=Bacillus cereus group TaxID=86661 RepID=A0A2B0W268_BACAN|nr:MULTISPECIES: DUF3994 domain-containing protein [Bacillus]KZD32289.1 hypothetical protein B4082_3513 [Bacillus cereus]MBJ8058778.1 DUF3994 domain-containing protein [Bacillus cereus]MCU4755378.1 DUF3994 domain-containing protein [Bacillus cereus]MCU5106461.1 DUF3994 domain-containing protein [Bacillus cereus]MDF2019975.1 DUF3994 domain-containing protein [Bacillus sp. Cr_R3]